MELIENDDDEHHQSQTDYMGIVVKVATGASGFRKSIVHIISLTDIFHYFVKNN